ncbi:MAG: hypothetical protein SGJ04_05985, partial [Bacteroidota bacterium]|nr:hypothetical protein [Bacteroidota bacterium]
FNNIRKYEVKLNNDEIKPIKIYSLNGNSNYYSLIIIQVKDTVELHFWAIWCGSCNEEMKLASKTKS